MNKHIYLGLSIIELSKLVIYEFWYDYVKPKYGKKAKLFHYIHKKTDIFTKDVSNGISKDVGSRFHTSNYESDKLLP